MKQILSILLLLIFYNHAKAQGRSDLTLKEFNNWPKIPNSKSAPISKNGRYFSYSIENYQFSNKKRTYIQELIGNWRISRDKVKKVIFSPDNKYVLICYEKDSLEILKAGEQNGKRFGNVSSPFFLDSGKAQYLVFEQVNQTQKSLLSMDITTEEIHLISRFTSYYLNNEKGYLVYCLNDKPRSSIGYFSFLNNVSKELWGGNEIKMLSLDKINNAIAFTSTGDKGKTVFFHIKIDAPRYEIRQFKLDSSSVFIRSLFEFTEKGEVIYCLQPLKYRHAAGETDVLIYSYNDKLIGRPTSESGTFAPYELWSYNPKTQTRNLLKKVDEMVVGQEKNGKYLIVLNGIDDDVPVDSDSLSVSLVETDNGYAYKFDKQGNQFNINKILFSPDSRYCLTYHPTDQKYYSFDLQTKRLIKLSFQDSIDWRRNKKESDFFRNFSVRGAYGFVDEYHLVIYSRFDMWLFDIRNIDEPVNLTGKLRAHRQIEFSIPKFYDNKDLRNENGVFLTGYDAITADIGFYRLNFISRKIEFLSSQDINLNSIQKAGTNGFLLSWDRSNVSNNFFWTKDFKAFKQLSFNTPKKNLIG